MWIREGFNKILSPKLIRKSWESEDDDKMIQTRRGDNDMKIMTAYVLLAELVADSTYNNYWLQAIQLSSGDKFCHYPYHHRSPILSLHCLIIIYRVYLCSMYANTMLNMLSHSRNYLPIVLYNFFQYKSPKSWM